MFISQQCKNSIFVVDTHRVLFGRVLSRTAGYSSSNMDISMSNIIITEWVLWGPRASRITVMVVRHYWHYIMALLWTLAITRQVILIATLISISNGTYFIYTVKCECNLQSMFWVMIHATSPFHREIPIGIDTTQAKKDGSFRTHEWCISSFVGTPLRVINVATVIVQRGLINKNISLIKILIVIIVVLPTIHGIVDEASLVFMLFDIKEADKQILVMSYDESKISNISDLRSQIADLLNFEHSVMGF